MRCHSLVRALRLFIAAALLLLPGAVAVAAVGEAHKVRVCGHPAYPPLSWTESGRVYGVAPTLIKGIFEKLGYAVSLEQDGNWKRCLKEVEQGVIDIVVALFKSEDRKRYLLYADEPIVKMPLVFFYDKNNPVRFDSWDDLKGKRVGILFGDIYGAEADANLAKYMRVEPVSNGRQNFEKLMSGRIDVMPLGKSGGLLQARKLGYQDRIRYTERPLVREFWYVGISRKSPLIKHVSFVDDELERLKSSGEVDQLMRYFSEEYLNSYSAP